MLFNRRKFAAPILVAVIVMVVFTACSDSPPLKASGSEPLVVMDFGQAAEGASLPEVWWERKFVTRAPMVYEFGEKDGRRAMRFSTDNSASLLGRNVDVALASHPFLEWGWLVEEPIESEISEKLKEGDDHPARLFVSFVDQNDKEQHLEIIWANREFKAGEYKIIGDFYHYVANGGDATLIGQWFDERLDLREIYRHIWGDASGVRWQRIGVFCDSDETNSSSIAWFSSIRLLADV